MDKNIINSAAYEDISDHVILAISDLQQYMSNFQLYKKDSIIYCKTDFTKLLFEHLRFSKRKYILITHHSDYLIDGNWFNLKPKNIIKWFAINAIYKHPNLIPIPMGIWTSEGRAYYQSHHKIKWFIENINRFQNKTKTTDLVYCNWGDTNIKRKKIIEKISKNVKYKWTSGLEFKEYCEEMSSYKFIIAPPGNGDCDTHRAYESLYMGCFPIVIKAPFNNTFKGLPIIQVNDYSEVTNELLEESLNKTYNLEKIYIEYWHKKIMKIL